MAVKIRLARRGRKKLAMYDVIVTHGRSPRDGVFIEKIGVYNPLTNPATIDIRDDRALEWLMKGAQPTDTVRAMFSYKGILIRKHLQVGVLKGALTQEEADKRFEAWKTSKDAKINAKIERVTNEKETSKKNRLAEELKVNETRANALRQKQAAKAKAEEKAAKAAESVPAAESIPATEEAPSVENTTAVGVISQPEVVEQAEVTPIQETPSAEHAPESTETPQ
jgi:small subunit ribosomal protein S16